MSTETLHKQPVEEQEPSSFRLIATLGIAGFLSGLILVSAYLFTKPYIEQNKAEALKEAIFSVLDGAVNYEELKLGTELLEIPSADNKDQASVYKGIDSNNEIVGFALLGAQPGFQDLIVVLCGYDPVKKQIIGFEVLESKETPGLGDKIFKDAAFQKNFQTLDVNPEILAVKKGDKANANQVECITGATISSKAVVNLLNNSIKQWQVPIDNYMKTQGNEQ